MSEQNTQEEQGPLTPIVDDNKKEDKQPEVKDDISQAKSI